MGGVTHDLYIELEYLEVNVMEHWHSDSTKCFSSKAFISCTTEI